MIPLHKILFILLTARLLMPPGICVCKWNAPAVRILVELFGTGKEVPTPAPETDDDHAPGCPASYLSVGMGVWPPSEPAPRPTLAPETPDAPAAIAPAAIALLSAAPADAADAPSRPPASPLYLTLCALRI